MVDAVTTGSFCQRVLPGRTFFWNDRIIQRRIKFLKWPHHQSYLYLFYIHISQFFFICCICCIFRHYQLNLNNIMSTISCISSSGGGRSIWYPASPEGEEALHEWGREFSRRKAKPLVCGTSGLSSQRTAPLFRWRSPFFWKKMISSSDRCWSSRRTAVICWMPNLFFFGWMSRRWEARW